MKQSVLIDLQPVSKTYSGLSAEGAHGEDKESCVVVCLYGEVDGSTPPCVYGLPPYVSGYCWAPVFSLTATAQHSDRFGAPIVITL